MRMSLIALGLAFAAALAVGAPVAAVETPLLSRELLFGNPERAAVTISPDGARLAYETDEAASVELADELSPAAAAQVIAYLAGVFLAAYGQSGMLMDSLDAPGSVGD